jgi:hypothetical protein
MVVLRHLGSWDREPDYGGFPCCCASELEVRQAVGWGSARPLVVRQLDCVKLADLTAVKFMAALPLAEGANRCPNSAEFECFLVLTAETAGKCRVAQRKRARFHCLIVPNYYKNYML